MDQISAMLNILLLNILVEGLLPLAGNILLFVRAFPFVKGLHGTRLNAGRCWRWSVLYSLYVLDPAALTHLSFRQNCIKVPLNVRLCWKPWQLQRGFVLAVCLHQNDGVVSSCSSFCTSPSAGRPSYCAHVLWGWCFLAVLVLESAAFNFNS